MIRALLIALALGASAPLAAQLPPPLPETAAGVATEDYYPPQEVTFLNGVRGIPDVVYGEPIGFRPLTLDLYLPPYSAQRPATGFPLVVYLHGGGWMSGDARRSGPFLDFPDVLAALSAKGYVVASINYRLSGEAKFPAQAQDVKAAIRWLRLNALRYDIDRARALTWGVSAGGHLAALTATSCNAPELEPPQTATSRTPASSPAPIASPQVSDCVQGGVAWYGLFDLATVNAQAKKAQAKTRDFPAAPEWQLLGCFDKKCKPKQIAAASPVNYVDRNDPPMLLIFGSEDTAVPPQQTLEMADKLKANGVKYDVLALPGVDHSLIGKTPEQTREANLKALEATFRFIDQTVGNVPGTNQ